nr:oligosaccharide flippase family protein [Paracoccaceae bacterium]
MPDSPQHGFRKSGLKRAAVTGWLWNFLIKATSIVLTALVFLITSRLLDPVSFGIVAFGAAVVALIAAVMPVAFGEALVQRQDLQDRHLNSVFWLCLGLAGAAYGLLALSAPLIAAYQENELLVPILLLLGSRLFFDAIGTVPNALLQRRMEFRALAVRSVVANLVGASFCLGLIWLGYPLWGLVASQVASPLVSMVIVVWVTRWHPSGGLDGVALRDVSRFGLYSMGHGVIHQARIDQLLFGMMLGPAMLGLYFFARRLYGLVSDLT